MAPNSSGERSTWLSRNQVESTIPDDFASQHGILAGDVVEIRPKLASATISFHVQTEQVDPDRVNARKIKQRVEPFHQTTLRFPSALAAVAGIDRHVARNDVSMRYDSADDGFFVETWPPLRPWMVPGDRADLDVGSYQKRLQQIPGKECLFLPTDHVDALGIEKGQPVAWRLSIHDGQFALVADLDIPAEEVDGRHIRRVQASQSGTEDHPTTQYHLYVPRAAVHALNWDNAQLQLDAGEDYLRLSPASELAEELHEVNEQVVADAEDAASDDAAASPA